ncbi:FAD-dependent oxidoreductase [archaeon]|nr:FAD-dependent oxidoreductase [archaeon]
MEKVNVLIVGGGVVGCAIAKELSAVTEDVFIVERNKGITQGENQSSRNSGVIHAGIYYSETRLFRSNC